MSIHNRESIPPPTIGKIGPYTVFLTPPAATFPDSPPTKSPDSPPTKSPDSRPLPVVQPPPQQFRKEAPAEGSVLGFLRNAVVKVQNAHSSLDEHVAHWFGLNQSKYQWALDDYYETKGGDQLEAKAAKDISSKAQTV